MIEQGDTATVQQAQSRQQEGTRADRCHPPGARSLALQEAEQCPVPHRLAGALPGAIMQAKVTGVADGHLTGEVLR